MALKEEMVIQGNFLFKFRSFLPIFILLVGLAVYMNRVCTPDYIPELWSRKWDYFALWVSLVGLFVRCICIGYSHDNTSGRNTVQGQIADEVNQSGMYAIARHPLYLGNFLMWLGIALLTANTWFVIAFIFMYWVYYERIMFAEEEYLRVKFGTAYESWAAKTPAFIPAFTQWTKPLLSFSLIKVIRQEKAGILNLFLVFFIFKNLPKYFSSSYQTSQFWTYALGLALTWYIIIKIIQKTTNLLSKDR